MSKKLDLKDLRPTPDGGSKDQENVKKLYNILKNNSEKDGGEPVDLNTPIPPPKELNLENFNFKEFQVFDKVEEILYEETNEKLILAGHLTFELLDNVDFGTDIDDIDEGNNKIRVLYNLLVDIKHGLDSMIVARNSWVC